MAKYHLHSVGSDFVAVANGPGGQVLRLEKEKGKKLAELMADRKRVGQALTAELRKNGLGALADDEETVVE